MKGALSQDSGSEAFPLVVIPDIEKRPAGVEGAKQFLGAVATPTFFD